MSSLKRKCGRIVRPRIATLIAFENLANGVCHKKRRGPFFVAKLLPLLRSVFFFFFAKLNGIAWNSLHDVMVSDLSILR